MAAYVSRITGVVKSGSSPTASSLTYSHSQHKSHKLHVRSDYANFTYTYNIIMVIQPEVVVSVWAGRGCPRFNSDFIRRLPAAPPKYCNIIIIEIYSYETDRQPECRTVYRYDTLTSQMGNTWLGWIVQGRDCQRIIKMGNPWQRWVTHSWGG